MTRCNASIYKSLKNPALVPYFYYNEQLQNPRWREHPGQEDCSPPRVYTCVIITPLAYFSIKFNEIYIILKLTTVAM